MHVNWIKHLNIVINEHLTTIRDCWGGDWVSFVVTGAVGWTSTSAATSTALECLGTTAKNAYCHKMVK